MKRSVKDAEIAVSPVIAVILMVAITVVLAAVLMAWVMSIVEDRPEDIAQGSLQVKRDGGSGDWTVSIMGVGPQPIAEMSVFVRDPNGFKVFEASPTTVDEDHPVYMKSSDPMKTSVGSPITTDVTVYMVPVEHSTNQTIRTPRGDLATYDSGTGRWMLYDDVDEPTKDSEANDALFIGEFRTSIPSIQGVHYVIVDNNDDGLFGSTDMLRLYSDPSTPDYRLDRGYLLTMSFGSTDIGAAPTAL